MIIGGESIHSYDGSGFEFIRQVGFLQDEYDGCLSNTTSPLSAILLNVELFE